MIFERDLLLQSSTRSCSRLIRGAARVAIILCTLLLVAIGAHAEEASAAQESSENLFKWINFAIVAGVILWFCVKKAPGFFSARADTVSSAIQKSTATKDLAEQQLHEAEARLQNLEQEIAELRATAERESAAEAERIRNLTAADAKKIEAAAKSEIEAAERATRLQLKALAANLAVDGAQSLLAGQLTPAAQESLINNFVKSLEGRPN
jgi:F-type H+-transporting ATPase subunit b